ncbi:MAG: tetratricopeptide repeat protein [Magnetococcales bacterium]|nr:tetratricopeptide repeat protein [Magnetococcales bacterium]
MSEKTPQTLTVDQAYAQALDHFAASRYQEADQLCSAIIQTAPNHIDAINLLGVIAQRHNLNELAVKLFNRAINIDSNKAWLFYNLGISLLQLGRADEAMVAQKKAVILKPDYHEAHCIMGNILTVEGRLDEAEKHFKKALEIKPDSVIPLYNLGNSQLKQGKLDDAIKSFEKVVGLKPDYLDGYNNLGAAFHKKGLLEEAIKSYKKALTIQPNASGVYNNLGFSLKEQGNLHEAIKCYQKSLALNPKNADCHLNMGKAQFAQGRLDEAADSYQKAIAISPDHAKAHSSYGDLLQSIGRIEESVVAYKKALAIQPDFVKTHDSLIFSLDNIAGVDSDKGLLERKKWAEYHAEPLQAFWSPHNNSPDRTRRLRVGYVGADFKRHSAAHIFGAMILDHNPEEFQIFCYVGNIEEDELSARFKEKSTGWLSIAKMDDINLVEQIKKDGIDILVDLSGHTVGNRLLAFARKPAPIQITAWGYPLGTAMAAMDYLFGDPIYYPVSIRDKYSEEIVDLPCYIHLHQDTDFPEITAPPACKNGYVTFGGFNRILKYNEQVYSLWAEILQKTANAKLLLKTRELDSQEQREKMQAIFLDRGISPDRLILLGTTSRQEHLIAHGQIDIMLDPFPHNGGTTTLESLRMGVPFLSCEALSVGPTGASILNVMGLDDWRAKSKEEYVELGVKFANDIPLLKKLRMELRSRFDSSVLGNSQLYVAQVEKIYRQLWIKWCVDKQ